MVTLGSWFRRLVLAFALYGLCPAEPAAAWTRTTVSAAEAHVDVNASGQARVLLELGVRVHGGWLSRFELLGLGAELTLEPNRPPSLITQDGRTLSPAAVLHGDNKLELVFRDKAAAPRAGFHRLQVAYVTRLPLSETSRGNTLRTSFTLPAWPVDLEDVNVWIRAPRGSRLPVSGHAAIGSAETTTAVEQGPSVLLRWHRAQLPRTEALVAEFEMPGAPVSAGVEGAASVLSLEDLSPMALLVALTIALLSWLKRLAVAALSRSYGAQALPLLQLPAWLLILLTAPLTLSCALLHAAHPLYALLCLLVLLAFGMHRRLLLSEAQLPTQPQSFTRALLIRLAAWLDATTPRGAFLLSSAYAVAGAVMLQDTSIGPWFEALLLATPLWLNGARVSTTNADASRPAQDLAA